MAVYRLALIPAYTLIIVIRVRDLENKKNLWHCVTILSRYVPIRHFHIFHLHRIIKDKIDLRILV